MRHTDRNVFKWKDNDLLFKNTKFMSIIEDPSYKTFWRVEYPDGMRSEDFYNKTRAKENCIQAAMKEKGMEWKEEVRETQEDDR